MYDFFQVKYKINFPLKKLVRTVRFRSKPFEPFPSLTFHQQTQKILMLPQMTPHRKIIAYESTPFFFTTKQMHNTSKYTLPNNNFFFQNCVISATFSSGLSKYKVDASFLKINCRRKRQYKLLHTVFVFSVDKHYKSYCMQDGICQRIRRKTARHASCKFLNIN